MLYLDSSALIKHYQVERGSVAFDEKLRFVLAKRSPVFTSVLTYAEIQAIVARRVRERQISATEGATLQDNFDSDWVTGFTSLPIDSAVLAFVRQIVNAHPLRGSDAVHLASALSLRDKIVSGGSARSSEPITFVTSDRQLITACQQLHLDVFDPEAAT